jgi:hypothetical protein
MNYMHNLVWNSPLWSHLNITNSNRFLDLSEYPITVKIRTLKRDSNTHLSEWKLILSLSVCIFGNIRFHYNFNCRLWYDKIWNDMVWYNIWYVVIWYDIWYDMVWYDIWYDILYGMVYDIIWYMIWYGRYDIWYDIYIIWYGIIWYIWYDMVWYDMMYDMV